MPASENITRYLQELSEDNPESYNRLFEAVYNELRHIARNRLRGERRNHTMQATDLVHEGYLKLYAELEHREVEWKNRKQFFAIASRAMKQILVDYARKRTRKKRPHSGQRVALDDVLHEEELQEAAMMFPDETEAVRQLQLAEAVEALVEVSPQGKEMFEMSYYLDLPHQTIAQQYQVSTKTVQRRLRVAEAWLKQRLAND